MLSFDMELLKKKIKIDGITLISNYAYQKIYIKNRNIIYKVIIIYCSYYSNIKRPHFKIPPYGTKKF